MSSNDIQTIANRNTTEIETAHFAEEDVQELLELDPSRVPKHPTAWCISLTLKGTKVMLRDNRSTNRTLLNSKKLRPLQDYPLKPGDLITLGRLQLKYNLLFNPFDA